jgi:hypothetical protein
MNVHRDIDNVIQVDFLGRSRNLHNGFSFLRFDSTGYELLNSYCTSALEGEAFLLADLMVCHTRTGGYPVFL